MIGFRLGDLNVYHPKNIICVRCSTTYEGQISLIKKLFEKYGGVYSYFAPRGTYEICCYLNNSFEFLLPKEDKVPNWILKDNRCFLAFFAGYIDAEGYISIRRRGLEIQSYDKNILRQSWKKLKILGITCPKPTLSKPAGYVQKNGT